MAVILEFDLSLYSGTRRGRGPLPLGQSIHHPRVELVAVTHHRHDVALLMQRMK
jgi:hypothetical protein